MSKQLVLVHGRAQEHKDAGELKAEWLAAWQRGLDKSGLRMPIEEHDIRFPYYGQALFDLVGGVPDDSVADIIVRGTQGDPDELEFMQSVLDEVRKKAGVTDAQMEAEVTVDARDRGVLNWGWVQAALSANDRHVPGASGASIALVTRDVYRYLRNPGIKNTIDTGVRLALQPEVPTVVVGHSLGSVVAFDLLRRDGLQLGWHVPLFVTLGSPLGVTAIRKSLRPLRFPGCAKAWFNAMDPRDVVALYPLEKPAFDVTPAIENDTTVDNHTSNRHGISGYLDDQQVARKIYDALV